MFLLVLQAGAFWVHGADFARELRQLLPYSPGAAMRGSRILSRGTRERVPAHQDQVCSRHSSPVVLATNASGEPREIVLRAQVVVSSIC